eukprot:TRINITY_DN21052_c0_g1_i2.p1 TRINITY_DN21052_c0_g1~~TRINITY_DN21052_c0_g1_i2.p1  ORF type:complete len:290 (+),score=60.87 TRINITY_DN21052_c0_g1_i2:62-871(+)
MAAPRRAAAACAAALSCIALAGGAPVAGDVYTPADGAIGALDWEEWPPAAVPETATDEHIWAWVTHSNKWGWFAGWTVCMALLGVAVGYAGRSFNLWPAPRKVSKRDLEFVEPAEGDYQRRRRRSGLPQKDAPLVPLEWIPPAGAGGAPSCGPCGAPAAHGPGRCAVREVPLEAQWTQNWAHNSNAGDDAITAGAGVPTHHGRSGAAEAAGRWQQPAVTFRPAAAPALGATRQSVVDGWHAQEQWDGVRWLPVHYWDPDAQEWFPWYVD